MILGLYQCGSPAGDISAGYESLDRALGVAAAANVEMLTMPEVFLPGYNAFLSASQLPKLENVADIVRRHSVALTIGLPEETDGATHNAAYAFGPDGTVLAQYRKIQLFGDDEAAAYTPGEAYVLFDYKGVRFGILICYDVEFPEHVRALVRKGAQVILVPTANMMPFINVNLIGVPGRAFECGVTIVYANYTGTEGDLIYTGHSLIAGPDGYPLAAKGMGEGLLVAELPESLLENGIPFSTQLKDYRTVETIICP